MNKKEILTIQTEAIPEYETTKEQKLSRINKIISYHKTEITFLKDKLKKEYSTLIMLELLKNKIIRNEKTKLIKENKKKLWN